MEILTPARINKITIVTTNAIKVIPFWLIKFFIVKIILSFFFRLFTCYHNWNYFASINRCIIIAKNYVQYLAREASNMNKLKIPENHSGVSKTLRLPENIVEDIQSLADIKNLSFNKVVISLLEFSLENLDEKDKAKIQK